MALLIDVYNGLVKEATEVATKEMIAERVELLDKYAALATELLNAEFPNNYDKNDVIALADKLIERDIVISDIQEKQAEAKELIGEYVKVSRDLLTQDGGEFNDATVEKLASTLYELDLEDEFSKEAQAIVEHAFLDELNKVAGTEFTSLEEVKEFSKEAVNLEAAGKWIQNRGARLANQGKMKILQATGAAIKHPAAAAGVAAAVPTAAFAAGRMSKKSGGDN
jgi:hypothetical protein